MEFVVNFKWYDDDKIWLATSTNDKFALTVNHVSFDALVERVKFILIDMVENTLGYKGEFKMKIKVQRTISMTTEDFLGE